MPYDSHAPNFHRRSCFFYFLWRLNPCMSLLGLSLLSRFSGIMNCRLVCLCFMSKSHIWVSTYFICHSESGLPHWIWCFLYLSICSQISRCHYFFHCVVLHGVNVLQVFCPFFIQEAFSLFPDSGYGIIELLWT